jgi:hypothetical protein
VTEARAVDDDGHSAACRDAQATVTRFLETLNADLAVVDTQAADRKRALDDESAKLRDLEARITLSVLMPEIRKFVEQAKWAERARTFLSRFPALLRGLTEATKTASEELVNQNFAALFEEECDRLRAPRVRLEFPGRRGHPVRKKALSESHRLSAILSEGEQKVLALADFLAEARLRQRSTPMVLDDPVTSLDYKRIEHIADRVVVLSRERQVIVFTHNIWFTATLLARLEGDRNVCVLFNVSQDGDLKGVLARGSEPRTDSLADLRARINRLLQDARGASGASREALVEKAYDVMRALCERVVVDEFLHGVVQPYQPNVRMTSLPRIDGQTLERGIARIMPLYEKCCRQTAAHAQPLETLSVRASLDECQRDWQELQEIRREHGAGG